MGAKPCQDTRRRKRIFTQKIKIKINYLAHAYLSFNQPQVLVGNMISDFVKGKKQFDYPQQIRHGIKLHRAIDHFTDEHLCTKKLKDFFRPHYRLYAGAFVDVVYDYCLANDRSQFSAEQDLYNFTQQTFAHLAQNKQWLGERFGAMFPNMQAQNWLFNYKEKWGIEKSFNGLMHRSKYIGETQTAYQIFNQNIGFINMQYQLFFPALKAYAEQYLTSLQESD